MFIQTETTPNPLTLKFLPGEVVMGGHGTLFLTNPEAAAKESQLAESLFEVKGVKAVFLGSDFVTVTKAEEADWGVMKGPLLTRIMDHYVAGLPILKSQVRQDDSAADDSELGAQIRELIDTRVRPAVAQDGGDITFRGFDEDSGVVYLEMHGACSGCPSSTLTLKQGIENMLKHYVPEVTAVEQYQAA